MLVETPTTPARVATAVEFRDAVKRFGRNEVLRGITNCANAGETVVVIGPSGSSKSTLLLTVTKEQRAPVAQRAEDDSPRNAYRAL